MINTLEAPSVKLKPNTSTILREFAERSTIQNISDMNKEEREILHAFSASYYNNMHLFLEAFVPGLTFMDPITDVVWLISSKNPDILIKSLLQTDTFSKFAKNIENFTEVYPNMTLNLNRPTNGTFFDKTLSPNLVSAKDKNVVTVIGRFKDIFRRLNKTSAFPNLLGALWFATLPCNDVTGMTADYDTQHSVLKICKWKGVKIPCSAIFSTHPTDQGMCCSFNKKPADQIFLEQSYSSLIERLQEFDRNNSFVKRNFAQDFPDPDEPFPQAGQDKGLYIMLDAHSDLLAGWSSESDYRGFTGLIDSRGSYPLVSQNGFMIKPGHINMVALTATNVDATPDLREITPLGRNCLFPDETDMLKFHKTYSQTNCLLECTMLYAQSLLPKVLNLTESCIPWYLPFPNSSVPMCDPWQAVEFEKIMADKIPGDQCSYCLPDCRNTIFRHSLTTLPFKECDESNIGISFLCNIEDQDLPQPRIWGQAVLDEYKNVNPKPSYISKLISSQRYLYASPVIFTKMERNYKAYEKDIAVLQVYFDSPTVFKFVSQPSQTWIGFFSAIGGLLGLCLGVSIVTIFEIFWLAFKLGEKLCHPTYRNIHAN